MGAEGVGWTALVISLFTGATYSAFAKPLTATLSPLSLLFVSEMLLLMFVLLSFGTVPTVKAALRLEKRYVLPMIATGIFSSIIGPLFWFVGLKMTTAVNANLLAKVDIVVMLILARIFLGEHLTRQQIFAVGTVLAGLLVVSAHDVANGMIFHFYDLMILLSVTSFAMGSIIFRKYLCDVPPHLALFVRAVTALVVFFLLSPFVTTPFIDEVRSLPFALLPALIGFGFISRFLNVFAYYEAVDRLPVTSISMFLTLDVIVSTVFARIYLGEALGWHHVFAALLIVLGNALLHFFGKQTHTIHTVPHPVQEKI